MDKTPIFILIAIFILVGLAYSPIKKATVDKGNNNSSRTDSSIGETAGKESRPAEANQEIAKEVKDIEKEVKKLEKEVDQTIAESQRSPYYGKIKMSNSISGLKQLDSNREYISLSTDLEKGESVKITGWYLQSEVTGYYTIIGKAALLPFPFTKTESDVVLKQKDRVYLTKGFSPIGISFRTNKCTGYFEEHRTFYPALAKQCPRPKDEDLPKFSDVYDRNDECLRLIEKIPRCTTVDSEFLRDLPDTVPSSCKSYLANQINYNFCITNHFSDTDFPGTEYRLYLNKFGPLWRTTHDTINLRDQNGLIVDTIKY